MSISFGQGGGGTGASAHMAGGSGSTTAWGDIIAFIRPLCRAMTAEGIPADKQLSVLLRLGIKVGDGGKGGAGSSLDSECAYCRQTGNGGHGGFCPNGNWQ